MTLITSLLAGGWHWIAALAAVVAALLASYFGGKKVGNVQTQAKADVKAAEAKSEQVQAVAKKQSDNTEKANSVKQANAALSDSAQRDKLRNSRFNSDD
ncbi:hypothetical protein F3J37_17905 [Pantoea sp. Al-1710]|uniref:DUF2681 domain-containing protein n=1 Tax=Candidatus Pantoea communis TaxID=2608354 RepID=A0ABX0RUC6_9GAMM|nr:hypothetical protein [Pantoea communis]NIG20552.1 hypothetical protein [Pantoea communis]